LLDKFPNVIADDDDSLVTAALAKMQRGIDNTSAINNNSNNNNNNYNYNNIGNGRK